MKLQYLGTAAAESFPGMFCSCPVCQRARAAGGRNIRSRSQALVDDRLLIDFPADTNWHVQQHGLSLGDIRHCLITHAHSDHLYPADLEMRCDGATATATGDAHAIYRPAAAEQIRRTIACSDLGKQNRAAVQLLYPYQPVTIDRYTVTPLPARHDPYATPYIYLISDGDKTLFYAHDTGILCDEVWAWLAQYRQHIDFVSLDCTGMQKHGWTATHLSLDTCTAFIERLRQAGVADDTTAVCLSHFSHNGEAIHDEFVPIAAAAGFDVAYDGKIVEI